MAAKKVLARTSNKATEPEQNPFRPFESVRTGETLPEFRKRIAEGRED